MSVLFVICISKLCTAQWTALTSLSGTLRYSSTAFALGNKGYVIGGISNLGILDDVWEYDVVNDTWNQKANFPGLKRNSPIAFVINNKGYYGLGTDTLGNFLTDLWEYNANTDSWVQKANFPDTSRINAVSFSIGNKGYIGLGFSYNGSVVLHSDFWEYNPINNSWNQKANFPGTPRMAAMGIGLNNGKGYVGLGENLTASDSFNDFYEYDPITNTWTTKQSMGSYGRCAASVFALNNEIVVVGGYDISSSVTNSYSTCVKYNPISDTWINLPNFSGGILVTGVALSFSNTAIVGIGINPNLTQLTNNWWKYNAVTTDIPFHSLQNSEIQVYPTPADDVITISVPKGDNYYLLELYGVTGKIVIASSIENNTVLSVKELSNGMYAYSIKSNIANQIIKKGKLMVNH